MGVLRTFVGHTNNVMCVAVLPDGNFVSGGMDKTVRLWYTDTDTHIKIFNEHKSRVSCVAVIPDGNLVISGSYDKTLRLWKVGLPNPTNENYSRRKATLQEVRTLPPMDIFPGGIEFQEAEKRFQNAQNNIRKTKKGRKTRKYARRSRSNKQA